MGAMQLISDNMDVVAQGGLEALQEAQKDKIADLMQEAKSLGFHVNTLQHFFNPNMAFSKVDREESSDSVVSEANEIKNHDESALGEKLSGYTEMTRKGGGHRSVPQSYIRDMNQTIRTPRSSMNCSRPYITRMNWVGS